MKHEWQSNARSALVNTRGRQYVRALQAALRRLTKFQILSKTLVGVFLVFAASVMLGEGCTLNTEASSLHRFGGAYA